MRTSRRFHFILPSELESALTPYAARLGLQLGPAIRMLVGRGLQSDPDPPSPQPDSPAALAALTASEHAVLMVASILPEGEQRMRSLAARAAEAAEERLALFSERGN